MSSLRLYAIGPDGRVPVDLEWLEDDPSYVSDGVWALSAAAATKALCLPHAGGEPARPCPVCVTEAEGALAAADAVDPLRDDDTLHALVARGIAALYSPEPPDAEDLAEARRVVAAIRGRGRSW